MFPAMSDLMNEPISDRGDCRTAPATPGLLTMWDLAEQTLGLQPGSFSRLFLREKFKKQNKKLSTYCKKKIKNIKP